MVDWESFFNDHGIDYVVRGPNVKKGNVNIACPMCGDDPSHHMGVALEIEAWGCWRGISHKGKKPEGLIRSLLGCSYTQAKLIAQQYSAADPENLDQALANLEARDVAPVGPDKARKLKYPAEFKTITGRGSTARFYHYLYNRGFYKVDDLIKLYDLKCATTGTYKDRIIIPIKQDGKLVSWTSRAIGRSENAPRYLALSEDDGGLVNVFHTLWNWDELMEGGNVLVVAEGPFDAMKLDYYAVELNSCATCTFGTSMSKEQAMMIAEASKRFKRTILIYDEGATEAIFHAQELLGHTDVEIGFLPKDVEDPGEMSGKQVRRLISKYI